MADSTDNGHRQPSPVDTIPTTIGIFTQAGRPACQWTVTWDPATCEVTATGCGNLTSAASQEVRVLARVPTVAYVHDLIDTIKRARGVTDPAQPVGFEDIAQWLARLDLALGATAVADPFVDNDAFYLDYDHRGDAFDPTHPSYNAPELWDDLEDNAAQASRLLEQLMVDIRHNGNLATAAARAQELAMAAIGMYIAFHEAYRSAHWHAPGPQIH